MTGKKFERTTPEAVGISSKSLERLIENLEQVTEMHGIVVMRHETFPSVTAIPTAVAE